MSEKKLKKIGEEIEDHPIWNPKEAPPKTLKKEFTFCVNMNEKQWTDLFKFLRKNKIEYFQPFSEEETKQIVSEAKWREGLVAEFKRRINKTYKDQTEFRHTNIGHVHDQVIELLQERINTFDEALVLLCAKEVQKGV